MRRSFLIGNRLCKGVVLIRRPATCVATRMDAYESRVVDGKLHISLAELNKVNEDLIDKTKSDSDVIPETVLQYERAWRKRRAAEKAQATVTKEQHLKVLYKDDHLVVTDKPSGILTVPGINHNPSLLTLVHEEFPPKDLTAPQMIIHRLDMDTSGVVVFGRTPQAVSGLQKAFRDRNVSKSYQALVCGHLPSNANEGLIDLPLQRDHEHPPFMRVSTASSEQAAAQAVHDLQHHGWKKLIRKRPKPSQTEWKVLSREFLADNKNLPVTRVKLTPITGRTHQLRVHMASLGFPIVGDPTYGIYGEASPNGGFSDEIMDQIAPQRASIALQKQINTAFEGDKMCLHAHELSLNHPITGETMTWEAPVPF